MSCGRHFGAVSKSHGEQSTCTFFFSQKITTHCTQSVLHYPLTSEGEHLYLYDTRQTWQLKQTDWSNTVHCCNSMILGVLGLISFVDQVYMIAIKIKLYKRTTKSRHTVMHINSPFVCTLLLWYTIELEWSSMDIPSYRVYIHSVSIINNCKCLLAIMY